jgi:hypothetical protein
LSGSGSEIGFEIGPQRWRERWPICAVVIAARHQRLETRVPGA